MTIRGISIKRNNLSWRKKGEKKTPSELPIPPAGSDILVEVWLPQKRWIGETGNYGGHRNVPSRPFSFGILPRGDELTGILATRS